jgi:hypothetical protein
MIAWIWKQLIIFIVGKQKIIEMQLKHLLKRKNQYSKENKKGEIDGK